MSCYEWLKFGATVEQFEQQARDWLAGWNAGDAEAIEAFHHNLPRFLDEKVTWLPKEMSAEELRGAHLDLTDAQLAVARFYSFRDWESLKEWAAEPAAFERAVEAVVDGDLATLQQLLRERSDLVKARSKIVTKHDPAVHGATLLHYIAANGVENFRQRTPQNAVAVARALLDAGADPNALAGMYGGACTTLSMLVSSSHPAEAGVQAALAETLLDYGASLDEEGKGPWSSPLMTALSFSYRDTAEALAKRGAKVETLAAAAGLGRTELVKQMLPAASSEDRHRALALSAQNGKTEVVGLLLDAGEDPNRFNPENQHSHSTPLHQAAIAGHEGVVRLLVERGARTDLQDTIWKATPLGWAEHNGQTNVAQYLRAKAAAN